MAHTARRPRRTRRLRRIVPPLVVVAGAVGVGRLVARRRPLIEPVAPELRSPILYLPLSLTSDRALRFVRSLPAPPGPIAAGVDVTSRTIRNVDGDDLRLVVYERPDRARPSGALLWIHGGGMVLGEPEQGHQLCSRVASELGVLVVSVDYRLAPEDPFPAGLDDCESALAWVHEQAGELGIDPSRVAVGGDSAGGGLAASLAQRCRDRGGPPICFQLLEYPMLDDRSVLRVDHGGRGAFVWTPASNRYAWTAYLGHPPAPADEQPYAAPARTTGLADLPPAWVGVGDLDLFYEEDLDYAARLVAAGVPCEVHIEPGMYHGADAILPGSGPGRSFRDHLVDALAAALGATETLAEP